MTSLRSSLILALDTGATSTKGMLTDLSGKIYSKADAPGLNIHQSTPTRFIEMLRILMPQLVDRSEVSLSWIDVVAVGAAGASGKAEQLILKKWIKDKWPSCQAMVQHDAFIAQYGAFGGNPGVIIISGTGSIAYGRNQEDQESRSGGWGWMLGDEGSGWWIGREAVRVVLDMREGGPITVLKDMVLDKFKISDIREIFHDVYAKDFDRKNISSLSEMVFEAAQMNDRVARSIFYRAGIHLGKIAVKTAKNLKIAPLDLEVSLLGSVSQNALDFIKPGVEDQLKIYLHDPAAPASKRKTIENKPDNKKEEENKSNLPSLVMPEFPPRDLTLTTELKGPRLVKPLNDALNGAAIWARTTLLKRKFA